MMAETGVVRSPYWRGEGELTAAAAQAVRDATCTVAAVPWPAWLVVEVIDDGDGAWLVMLSTRSRDDDTLRALIAFGGRAAHVDRLRQLGFLATEALVELHPQGDGSSTVSVADPLCVTGTPACWLRVHGVRWPRPLADAGAPWLQRHRHLQAAPAPENPDRQVEREVLIVTPRHGVQPQRDDAAVELLSLGAIDAGALLGARWPLPAAQAGWLDLPRAALQVVAAGRPDPGLSWAGPLQRAPRPALLAATGYRFTNVDIVGFRIDLGDRDDVDATLQAMVEPLNFHRHPQGRLQGWGAQAFHWRPAARVLVIELLRYGRMYWGEQPPQPDEPWTAQHELLLRVLVGRVDDDGAQARDPALFVPAIFVDNPWSRWIGRELQGFPKQLARFCTDRGPLDLSGRLAGARDPSPLVDVTRVQLRPRFSADDDGGAEVLGLELPPGADDPALWADVRLLMGHAGALRRARWRQGDFVDPLFRRGFAGEALGLDPARMPSVQVSPVDGRALPSAWIGGAMVFERMEAAVPDGIARLRLPRDDASTRAQLPPAWQALRRLFPEGVIALSTGSWYRARADLCMEPDRT